MIGHRADLSPCKLFQKGIGCMARQPDHDDDKNYDNDDHVLENGENKESIHDDTEGEDMRSKQDESIITASSGQFSRFFSWGGGR